MGNAIQENQWDMIGENEFDLDIFSVLLFGVYSAEKQME